MDRIVLCQHLIRYLLTASLSFCFYTLISYLGFPIKLHLSTWTYITLSNSLIWTAYTAHRDRLYICFKHLGWPASRALRAPYIFSVLVVILIFIGRTTQQNTTYHHFSIDCQQPEDQVELCVSRTSSKSSRNSKCQQFTTASKQFCQKLTNQLPNKLLLPYQKELNLNLSLSKYTVLTPLSFQQSENNYTYIIIELLTRLIMLKGLIFCLIHVPMPQVFSILMICFTICTELVLSFK